MSSSTPFKNERKKKEIVGRYIEFPSGKNVAAFFLLRPNCCEKTRRDRFMRDKSSPSLHLGSNDIKRHWASLRWKKEPLCTLIHNNSCRCNPIIIISNTEAMFYGFGTSIHSSYNFYVQRSVMLPHTQSRRGKIFLSEQEKSACSTNLIFNYHSKNSKNIYSIVVSLNELGSQIEIELHINFTSSDHSFLATKIIKRYVKLCKRRVVWYAYCDDI